MTHLADGSYHETWLAAGAACLRAMGGVDLARAVATVLAEARKSKGLTQRDLAQRVSRPHSVIGMIETEQRQVTVPEFITLAEAIGKDPIELLRTRPSSNAIAGKPATEEIFFYRESAPHDI